MTATRQDVNHWIKIAKKNNHKYIISVCNTWDYDDYPVFFDDVKTLEENYSKYTTNMQKINEIIRINDDGTFIENLTIFNIK
jgi:hypothetical protein